MAKEVLIRIYWRGDKRPLAWDLVDRGGEFVIALPSDIYPFAIETTAQDIAAGKRESKRVVTILGRLPRPGGREP